jgi:hypothetical protein
VAEYCTDETMTNCTPDHHGRRGAPAVIPKPAKVRWCDSRALTNCQAKYVGNFKYPRYSNPASANVACLRHRHHQCLRCTYDEEMTNFANWYGRTTRPACR